MRGSITAYRMSTKKLTITIMVPPMRTVAWTTGKSRNEMPSNRRRPTPGHAKTVSTTTATLTMMTRLMPASVSTGMSAFLKACLAMTNFSGSPLRRASFTYSEPSTSSMDERVSLMWAAAKYQPSANAGMTMWSAVPEPEEGSQPRYTEKNRIITRPTQNEGSDSPSSAKIFPALSHHRFTYTATRMPLGMPTRSENAMAASASAREYGRRER